MSANASQTSLESTPILENLSRGEATDMIVKYFDLQNQNKTFLQKCDFNLEECLFSFTSRSSFDEIRMKPLILYPDVYPAYKYYKSINIASELDLVRGYYDAENSPYKPEQKITKIEALKLTLGASGLVAWKDKFEFSLDQKSKDEAKLWITAGNWIGEQWWYGRYIYSAVSKGILVGTAGFEANAEISKDELLNIMDSTRKILANTQGDRTLVDKYGQANKEANTSANSGI